MSVDQQLSRRWPDYTVGYQGKTLSVLDITDAGLSENDPTGKYYIIESDQTNSYGFHLGGDPATTVESAEYVDGRTFGDSARGHVRVIAEMVVSGLAASITAVNRPLLDREGA